MVGGQSGDSGLCPINFFLGVLGSFLQKTGVLWKVFFGGGFFFWLADIPVTRFCPPYLFYGSLRHVLSKYEVYEAMCIWEACLLMGVRTIYRNSRDVI